jgi:uncharacterized membrane protein/glutaredoxin
MTLKNARWLAFGAGLWLVSVIAGEAAVRAVLFYSPTCPHCQRVLTQALPPLLDRFGKQLRIARLDVTRPAGRALYVSAVKRYAIPEKRRGVPTLVVGETVLVGEDQIPRELPGLIVRALAAGGTAWPDIPGLAAALPPEITAQDLAADRQVGWRERFARDPVANGLAIAVLGLMALVAAAAARRMPAAWRDGGRAHWPVPVLALAGLAISGYLAYVETSGAAAVCGPVGNCNAVQQSDYARLLGVPIAVLGVYVYVAVLAAWAISLRRRSALGPWAHRLLVVLAAAGVAFSAYLTFLEPFVIGATCLWCLASALIMTALLWISTRVAPVTAREGSLSATGRGG